MAAWDNDPIIQAAAPRAGNAWDNDPVIQAAPQAAKSLVEQIPGADGRPVPPQAPQQETSPSIMDRLASVLDVPVTAGQNLLASGIGQGAAIYKALTGGKYGTPEGAQEARRFGEEVAKPFRRGATTQTGGDLLQKAGELFEESKLAGLPVVGQELPMLGRALAQQRQLATTLPAAVAASPEAEALRVAGRAMLPKKTPLNLTAFETLQRAQAEGLVVPPSSVNPNFLNTTLESIGGKIATAQQASNINQPVFESLARRAVGVADDAPLTADTMQQVRAGAWQRGYAPIAQIGTVTTDAQFHKALDGIVGKYQGAARSFPGVASDDVNNLINGVPGMHGGPRTGGMRVGAFDSNDGLQAVQVLRDEASAAFAKGETGVGKAKRAAAQAVEAQIERALEKQGAPAAELLQNFRAARALMAKSHSLEDALREGAGTLDAKILARQLQRGEPLSDELETIARFANTFEKAAQRPGQVAGPGVHNLTTWAAGGGGIGGTLIGGPVGGAIGAAAPLVVPRAIRGRLLSKSAQQRLLANAAPENKRVPASQELTLAEGPYEAGGLPQRPFPMSNLLELADEPYQQPTHPTQLLRSRHDVDTIDFPLRQEVLQQPEISSAIDAFRSEAARLQQIADNAISPRVRAKAQADLSALQEEFAAGMRQLGIQDAADAHGLNRRLYESGRTQLPIQRTFTPTKLSDLLR